MKKALCTWGLILVMCWQAGWSWAQATQGAVNWPRRPFLAVDSTAHTDEASYLVLTPDDRQAVTAAYDGTVRVWDVQSGELLQRFYLPKDTPNGARLRGLAFSPDGQRLAVASLGKRHAIFILSLRTGRIERTISSAEPSGAVAWSRDGRFLAVGRMGGSPQRGVRIHSAETGEELFRDAEYFGNVGSVEFNAGGTLMATSWDGRASLAKLYRQEGGTWRVTASRTPRFGDFRNRWDASGKSVLVGAHTRLDGETLADLPHELHRRGMPPSVGFSRVAQSPDGKYFFGGSWALHHPNGYMRRWTGAARSDTFEQVKLPDPRIADLAVTRKGEVVYLSDHGAVGMVDADFKLAWRVAHDATRLERRPQALKVTDSGYVLLPYGTGEEEREIAFNLAAPEFVPLARVREPWKAPPTSGKGVGVLAWEGTNVGTVNDARLPMLESSERSLSVAVHSSDGTLAVGSNFERLYKISAKGERIWHKYLGSDVLAVNLIEPRDLLVAATASGMLWVFNWSTGQVVMVYYLQPQHRRWLAISTQGYYEASTGAEDLAGWIVNPSESRVADFMPMSRFRATLLLTGLGQQAWESRSEAEAVKQLLARRPPVAGREESAPPAVSAAPTLPSPAMVVPSPPSPPSPSQSAPMAAVAVAESSAEGEVSVVSASAVRLDALPPRIEVVAPGFEFSTDQRQVRIRFKVASDSAAPVTQIRTMVTSASASSKELAAQAASGTGDERELTLDIQPEDTEIRLVAENRHGASPPTLIRVNYTGPKPQQVAAKGNLYLLAAGVSRYEDAALNLALASKDARDFIATLTQQRGALYGEVHVRQLLDKDASKGGIESGFQWLRQNVTARDTVVVFFAGHGFNDGPTYYFMTHEADLDRLPRTAVPFSTIRSTLAGLPGRVLVFVDTCHSGNVIGKNLPRRAGDATNAVNDLASSENGLVVFASSTGEQLSQENPTWGNGAFTKAVIEGLQGAADFKKRGRVTYKGLDAYVSDRVDELTKGEQTPVTPMLQGVPDFPIALLRR